MINLDLDVRDLEAVAREIGASHVDVRKSINRACTRTAGALRRMGRKGLRQELELRNAKAIRRRIKQLRLRRGRDPLIEIWFGANDLPVSAFKGTPRKGSGGPQFRGQKYRGAFIAKNRAGKRTVFKRKGASRYPLIEQRVPVKDKMDIYIQDEIFVEADRIFMKEFTRDLKARTFYGVG